MRAVDEVPGERRRVMLALAEQETWPQHAWAYDGQSALYTSQSFLPTVESAYEVWICPPSKESVFVPAVSPRICSFTRGASSAHARGILPLHLS